MEPTEDRARKSKLDDDVEASQKTDTMANKGRTRTKRL